jgi:UDPglucose 6-dehydrogenase
VCADTDAGKIARLARGEVPIYEPGLDALIASNAKAGRLRFSTDVDAAIGRAEIVFIAVGTPPAPDGSADLSAVFDVARRVGRALDGFKVVATKSTVPVGTADRIQAILAAAGPHPFGVASNPEFLKEGAAIEDFMKPDRVVIGTGCPRARAALCRLYAPFVRTNDRIHLMDARSAELAKYAANALLAARISFMNDLAGLAEKLGADVEMVRRAVGADERVGPRFLFPGPGFGGSCFPKDIAALLSMGRAAGHDLAVVRATEEVNARQKRVLCEKIARHHGGSLAGRTVAIWGLSFKPHTDDVRESPSLALIDGLLAAGAVVHAHDPRAMPNVKALYGDRVQLADGMYGAAEGADALALVTEWHEYRTPDFRRLLRVMRVPALFDGRNAWAPAEVRALGFSYEGIGRR